jgi:hypothetical protein
MAIAQSGGSAAKRLEKRRGPLRRHSWASRNATKSGRAKNIPGGQERRDVGGRFRKEEGAGTPGPKIRGAPFTLSW